MSFRLATRLRPSTSSLLSSTSLTPLTHIRAPLPGSSLFSPTAVLSASSPRWIGNTPTRRSTWEDDVEDPNDPSRPKASHPTKHKEKAVKSGEPVAEHTKENEERLSGVPKHEEGSEAAPLAQTPAPDLFSLTNRTIFVTGGARGLGLTVAHSFLESGADVVCFDVLSSPAEDQWEQAQSAASKLGQRLTYTHLDVTDTAHIASVFSKAFNSARPTHPVRGLFHSAGINVLKPALEIEASKFARLIEINLTGSFLVSRGFAQAWLDRHPDVDGGAGEPGASIVLVASMSGRVANYGMEIAGYNASKAGVVQLVKNLALEWSKRGIRVNSLSPGYIKTAMTAALFDERPSLNDTWTSGSLLGRLSTPDEFRGPAIFLLSDSSSFATGMDLLVDGGHTAH